MKKFVFSLQKVLDYKQQILDLLKNELFRLQQQRREIEEKIDDGNREFKSTNRNLVIRMEDGMAQYDIAAYKSYLQEINRRILLLQADRQKVMEAIAAKQEEIVRMNSDISGLEHLKDHQLEEYRSQERKEQELQVEEFVSRAESWAG